MGKRPTLPLLCCIACLGWGGCSRSSQDIEDFKGLFGQDTKAFGQWFPVTVKEAGKGHKVNPDLLEFGGAQEFIHAQITLHREDTLALFRLWSGLSDRELLAPNPDLGRTGFREGAVFLMRMTRDHFERFSAKRDLYHHQRAAARERGETVLRHQIHVVAKDETLQDIVRRYPTRIDPVMRANPELRLRLPYVGQEIRVPIIAEVEEERRTAAPAEPDPPVAEAAANPSP